jgi:uncharacterized delta-60 repeat protein
MGLGVIGATPASSWPGDFNAGFGDGGVVVLPLEWNSYPAPLAVDSNDRIVVANKGAVVRLTAGGGTDTGFGSGGTFTLDIAPTEVINALAVQPDGKVVLAGWVADQNQLDPQAMLVRLQANGTLDPSFDGDGIVLTDVSQSWNDVALGSGGSITLLGAVPTPDADDSGMLLARYTSTGAPDTTLGGTGSRSFSVDEHDTPHAIALQPDGRTLIGGQSPNTGGWIARLETDGAPDESFGSNGFTGGMQYAPQDLVLEPSGTIVGANGGLVRLSSTGQILQQTGSGGIFLARQADGRIVSAVRDNIDLRLWRMRTDLALDQGFGFHGFADLDYAYVDNPTGLALQSDGDIVVAGEHTDFRAVTVLEGGPPSGLVLDGWGGLHSVSVDNAPLSTSFVGAPYWKGWDIARGVTLLRDGTGGFELDGWGGIHSFGVNGHAPPPRVTGGLYWPGWDIARDIALLPDETGGYVLDGWGAAHRFAIGTNPLPPPISGGPSWVGWDIARGISLLPDGSGGYILDGWGGIHPFSVGAGPEPDPVPAGSPYWPGWDIARDIEALPFGGAYLLDGWGGVHQVSTFKGEAPPPVTTGTPYWPGWDIARSISVS